VRQTPFRNSCGQSAFAFAFAFAFAGGAAHYCLGANLARREIGILFEELLARTKEIEVLKPMTFSVLGLYNPILVVPQEIEVRLS
jgi:cytochrome P450